MNEQLSLFPDNPEYDAFVAKFEPKKTTDDCYTPPLVYEAIKNWACAEYGIDPESIVRPFYPGGDYERFDYSGGAVVLDNPPFSILSQIANFTWIVVSRSFCLPHLSRYSLGERRQCE